MTSYELQYWNGSNTKSAITPIMGYSLDKNGSFSDIWRIVLLTLGIFDYGLTQPLIKDIDVDEHKNVVICRLFIDVIRSMNTIDTQASIYLHK